MKRLFWIAMVVVSLTIPGAAFAQFGKIKVGGSKTKFDTKRVTALQDRVDKVVVQYEEATAGLWNATETLQELIAQFKAGEFPVLTQNWKTIKKEFLDAKDDAARKLALDKEPLYLTEMVERGKAVRGVLDDAAQLSEVKGKLGVPEKDRLKEAHKGIKDLPTKDKALITEAKAILSDSTKVIEDLSKQIKEDPVKANDYKKMLDKLNASMDRLKQIVPELEKQIAAVETLLGDLSKLID